nr:MAG TPA: hypothetical protein [Caudoviricetes sp.]
MSLPFEVGFIFLLKIQIGEVLGAKWGRKNRLVRH